MRIITGKYRGRKIISPEGSEEIRPTSDMAREGIFNVLQCYVEGSRFIDLFAGSGAMGIEALSRGSGEVLFCDNGRQSMQLLKKNLSGIDGKYNIVCRDFRDALRTAKGKWDYVFCDPPYKCDYIAEIAAIIAERDLLEEDGMLIYEHDNDFRPAVPQGYECVKSKKYGRATVEFYRRKKSICAVTGSFDPFTKGHRYVVEKALEQFEKAVVVVAVNPDKKRLFTLDESVEIAGKSLEDLGDKVEVDVCYGMVADYCNGRGITAIVRGYRNAADFAYEKEMSEYNFERGGVVTLLVEAEGESKDVSATAVRKSIICGAIAKDDLCDGAVETVISISENKTKEE